MLQVSMLEEFVHYGGEARNSRRRVFLRDWSRIFAFPHHDTVRDVHSENSAWTRDSPKPWKAPASFMNLSQNTFLLLVGISTSNLSQAKGCENNMICDISQTWFKRPDRNNSSRIGLEKRESIVAASKYVASKLDVDPP